MNEWYIISLVKDIDFRHGHLFTKYNVLYIKNHFLPNRNNLIKKLSQNMKKKCKYQPLIIKDFTSIFVMDVFLIPYCDLYRINLLIKIIFSLNREK